MKTFDGGLLTICAFADVHVNNNGYTNDGKKFYFNSHFKHRVKHLFFVFLFTFLFLCVNHT